jgi:hypothetical protein
MHVVHFQMPVSAFGFTLLEKPGGKACPVLLASGQTDSKKASRWEVDSKKGDWLLPNFNQILLDGLCPSSEVSAKKKRAVLMLTRDP